MFEDVLILGNGHSIILGHKPNKVNSESLAGSIFKDAKVMESSDSFGLFGGSINYNTFYPDLKPEDITPVDGDFIEPVFRMLSECIVSKYAPTDFSRNNVLKKSMKLLIGQTINCDHETDTGNAIGAVSSVFWQESYEENGKTIPAGINGLFKIDAKSNPRLARGIMMDPPSIHSNSVTVRFLWEQSHPKLTAEDFYYKMGTYDADGNLICRVVTEIISYMETSLVSAGADPFAKQIRDGKIVLPDTAQRNYSYSAETGKNSETPFFFMDYKDMSRMDTIHNTMYFNYEKDITTKNKSNMNELELFLASLFGEGKLSLAEGQEKTSETALAAITGLIGEVAQLKTDKENLTRQLGEKQDELDLANQDKPDAAILSLGKTTLETTRNLAVENYKKVMGENADTAILTLLGNADHTTLVSLNKGYEAQLEEKFPLACTECGSHSLSRASSSQSSEEPEKEVLSAPKETSDSIASLRERKFRSTPQE